jgi:hypothetical protein
MSKEDAEEIAKYTSYESYKKIRDLVEQDFENQWSNFVVN